MQYKKIWFGGIAVLSLALIAWLSYSAINSTGIFKPKPNFVIILTDDLSTDLMPYMKNTDELITQKGVTFTNYFVTSPLCCPSRASMIRGQYPHNTNILENSPAFRNFYKNQKESETIATWLNDKGYKTSLIGKYLNGYPAGADKTYVPPGWSDWHAFLFEQNEGYYYDYALNENGKVVRYGNKPEDYSTDVIGERSIQFINNSVSEGSPFFIVVSVYAPHNPYLPAPRHSEMYQGLEYPKSISFNEPDLTDKPSTILALTTTGDEFDKYDADAAFQKRVQSVQAVDELVGDIVSVLEKNGQLDNTYIIFTSDNGYRLGEHGIPSGKALSYEEDIHVPFMIRGPGIQPNTTMPEITSNIDIAPTIADLAGARASAFVDGRSAQPFLHPQNKQALNWRKGLLIETGYLDTQSEIVVYRGLRAATFIYIEYENGDKEYYDLASDPFEINNIADKLDPAVLSSLHSWLEQLMSCESDSCRMAEENMPNNLK